MAKLLYVVGLGPGDPTLLTGQAKAALDDAQLLCGYKVYIDLVAPLYPGKPTLTTAMTQEVERCRLALEAADRGQTTAMVCSGDAGVYGMAGLIYELAQQYPPIEIHVVPGITAAMSGAAFLCYVTPAEHLALPNLDDVKQGIVASKIAAHAADIAKGIPHARDIDDKMGDARRVLDWDAQFACAIDPETAKAIRDARLPEDDHSDTCSMCGKFCAVRSMNKALAGEYIDIL